MANGSSKVPIEYEEIKVTNSHPNSFVTEEIFNTSASDCEDAPSDTEAQNLDNVLQSALSLREQTYKALKDGFYPIVLGGDQSQAIGSISGMKSFMPDAKLLWIDAHLDAKSHEANRDVNGMPLSFLSGKVPGFQACVDIEKDLCYFGVR